MDLFIIRHAIAEPRTLDVLDGDRRLTERGRRRFEIVVAGLKRMGVQFDLLLTSPWRRAVETAALASVISGAPPVMADELAAEPTDDLLALLEGETVGVVGHEPWMGELLAWLVRGDPGLPPGAVLKKGSVAWLVGEPQPGWMQLRALLPPRVFRDLAC